MMVIESIIVTGLIALVLYGGTRWLQSGANHFDAEFRAQILHLAAEVAAADDLASVQDISHALREGARTQVLRVECILRKLSPSNVECKTVVALPHSQGVLRRTVRQELAWDELPSQVRADFIRHGGEEQVYLLYDCTERSEESNV